MYRDSSVIVFRNIEINEIYCRLCLRDTSQIPLDIELCSNWTCVCGSGDKHIHPPYFDNSKHEILLSSNRCILCNSCSSGNNPTGCTKGMKNVVIEIMGISKIAKRVDNGDI